MFRKVISFISAIAVVFCAFNGTVRATEYDAEKNCASSYVAEKDGLSFCWSCIVEETGAGEPTCILVRFFYRWESMPFCRLTDTVSVTWDGSEFEMEPESFRSTDMIDGTVLDQFGSPAAKYRDQIISTGTEHDAAYGSVIWKADIPAVSAVVPTCMHGYGCFRLKPVNGTKIGEEPVILRGKYVHKMLGTEKTWETGTTLIFG